MQRNEDKISKSKCLGRCLLALLLTDECMNSKITDMEKVYEFWYNDCIYESAAACMSLHRTRKGAEMAMEFHKEQKRKEFEELYKDEDDIDWTFDSMSAWGVSEREVVE